MTHIHGGNVYQYQRQIADFSANINFLGMPGSVRTAALEAVERSVHYPEPACVRLCKILAAREGVLEQEVFCGNGAAELMFLLAQAVRPRTAVLAQPCFFEYEQALDAVGCRIHHIMLSPENGFRVEPDFAERIPEGTGMVILGNPNNPTGALLARETLERILERCRRDGIFLVLDESFFDFLTEEDRSRTLEGTKIAAPHVFVLKSFTKMYAMPGLRFGYGICRDQSLIARMRRHVQPWNVSLPAQMAAEAAARELEFANDTARITAENREKLAEGLRKLGYPVFDACANYLLFRGGAHLQDFCLERGFLIRDCGNFRGLETREQDGTGTGDGTDSYYRICVRSCEENERLLSVLRKAAPGLPVTGTGK